MKKLICLSVALLLLLVCPLVVFGDPIIQFQATNLGGTTWQYDYTVQGAFLANQGFKIYFAFDFCKDLVKSGSQPGWDILTLERGTILGVNVDGQYDALALSDNDPASIVFSVKFEWLGIGSPGSQFFDVYDLDDRNGDGELIFSHGYTGPKGTVVPEPATLALVCIGLAGTLMAGRRKR